MRPSIIVGSAIGVFGAALIVLGGCRGILGIDDVSLRDDAPVDGATDGFEASVVEGGADAKADGADAAVDPFAGPVCTTDRFCWENPLPQGNTLKSVWAASAKEVWAVGEYGTVLRYDGARWGGYARNPVETLTAITGDAKGRLWVVGTRGGAPVLITSPGKAGEPTGTSWTDLAFAVPDGGAPTVPTSIWYDGADKLYVGGTGTTTTTRLYSYSVSSKTWAPIITTDNVRAVWGKSATDVWAVGENNLIQHFTTATGWVGVPSNVGNNPTWSGVAGTGSLTWVVGNAFVPLIVEIGPGGSAPATVTTPDNQTRLSGVAVSSDGTQAWAVAQLTGSPSVILERNAGSAAWATATATGDVGDGLFAVAPAGDEVWAVGVSGALVHRTASWSSAFSRVSLGVDDYGHHLAPASASDVWVAGDAKLYRFGGAAPVAESIDAGTPASITDVHAVGTDLWATTRSGLRQRTSSGVWTAVSGANSPAQNDQLALWAVSSSEAVVVSAYQDTSRLRAGTWSSISGVDFNFRGVWAPAINDYWTVGYQCCDNPAVLHLAGPQTWVDVSGTVVGSNKRGRLASVWGPSATQIYVGGLVEDLANAIAGQIYTYGGATWQPSILPVPAGDLTHYSVRAIHGLSTTSDVWAGGIPRYVWHTKPGGWELQATGTVETITAIHARAIDDVWLAGTGGVVLRRR